MSPAPLTVGKYTFSAWLRKGIGSTITETDTLGATDGTAVERATVPIDVNVNAQGVHKDFALLGPGDVVGINSNVVVRTEPHDWVTDFEPNYLPFIELYDEDFLWRYTPASAAGDRLRPWLALAVLVEDTPTQKGEFTLSSNRLPLPSVTIKSSASLPSHTQLWAWGHVHTNDAFPSETDFEKFLDSLATPDDPGNDRIVCRLTSPRKLAANTPYSAFVVPVFETGRLAGLGQDPSGVSAQKPAWGDGTAAVELPVFYQWRFRTGEDEDFESMVKRLVPQPADPRVGIRDMDGEQPGWGLTAGTDIGQIVPADLKQSVIGLEGALKSPSATSRPAVVDTTKPFFTQLQSVLNFPAQLAASPSTAPLPVVEPPIYGQYHAMQDTIDVTKTGWLDGLNRDPRNRVPAGFGVSVVRENQESYVARAWTQVQSILAANRVIRLVAYAMRASQAVYANFASTLAPERAIAFFSPVLRKVRGSPTTLQHLLNASTLPRSAVSGAMRRFIRPRGAVGRRIAAADAMFSHGALIKGLAADTLTAAPPKQPGADLATDAKVNAALPGHPPPPPPPTPSPTPSPTPPPVTPPSASHNYWLLALIIILVLLLIVALITGAWIAMLLLAAVAIAAYAIIVLTTGSSTGGGSGGGSGGSGGGTTTGPAALFNATAAAAMIKNAPPQTAFRFVQTDPVVAPVASGSTQISTTTVATSSSANALQLTTVSSITAGATGADTVEANHFRAAAIAMETRLSVALPVVARGQFDLANANTKLTAAVNPLAAFPRRVAAGINFTFDPTWLLQPENLVPAMAYPDFDDPMYEPLRDISSELLLPNLNLLPDNSITLLESNPPFIEAYLAGLNYEFGKELLWREYPTDRRGSYFRQFWDTRGIIADDPTQNPATVSEQSKDITPMDTWTLTSALGSHRNPLRPPGDQVVLTIRGDLLKKYPNTLVYAQKAHLARDAQGNPEPSADPVIATVATDADVQNEIKFPVFKAAVDPDIQFYGFDLTIAQARGDANPQTDADNWGYYFIIQQLPGEPRFGMEVAFEPNDGPITWDDLAWTLFPDGQSFIDVTVPPSSFTPAGPSESLSQWGTDSAHMASILLRDPVMIAVHAKEMLAGLG
jgi:hypothetical protein